MRWLGVLVASAVPGPAGCGAPATYRAPDRADNGVSTHAELAPDDGSPPPYGKAEIERALITERGKEAGQEQVVASLAGDDLRAALADLAVRRRFIATLESCQAASHGCPPRLDDPAWSWAIDGTAPPPLDTPLRYDLDDWHKVTAELHGRACACRTIACLDGLTAAIDVLETRPTAQVLADDASIESITRARECLFRLRGKK